MTKGSIEARFGLILWRIISQDLFPRSEKSLGESAWQHAKKGRSLVGLVSNGLANLCLDLKTVRDKGVSGNGVQCGDVNLVTRIVKSPLNSIELFSVVGGQPGEDEFFGGNGGM
eukprot:CAMPEP_0202476042 /NCGR_PEP_ID=MMETSP1360-20130828/93215_1 /ASSEMBLY_ACC=CAM_ASM_000848 /TAXON_ID=515479 /ORGANISM="Licmophora paradoxa, Strain CCMP2313" /LENGTH=113 /DNA_ID=CAMNT_0049103227 /DNA_START=458 /DNA_END=799 /DNA_ORIENTATION=+